MTTAHHDLYMLDIEIAQIGIRLACAHPELIDNLAQRYQGFTTRQGAQVEVVIQVNDRDGAIDLSEKPLLFERERILVDAPDLEGSIDCARGVAEIKLPARKLVENVEYFLRMVTAFQVFYRGGLLLHAAGIVKDGCAYLFFGHSGAGKTTVARHSSDYLILNDDLIVLTNEAGSWRAHATPFSNPTQVMPTNQSAPLRSICRLVQDVRVYLETISPGYALAEILASVPVIPDHPFWRDELLLRCQSLVEALPVRKLHFLPDGSFWDVIETSRS